ncbi:leucyl aminopeptidase [Lamprobacter modestohalophilus]|uniref:Probable cytosol aminopeptidase n=1 Tax=Lamprobacter modestohalophilus TaxID=1064514 RepID=A0A9X0W7Y3_9GAMM|nr:leucyl aminopeptidase [Lamprobacter modestohalophilus]MBK1618531.1 leucyl aminopeptidase [Lamprobacter modestohalophilus]
MQSKIIHGDLSQLATPCLILGVFSERQLSEAAKTIDSASNGALTAVLEKGDLDGKTGSTLMLYGVNNVSAERLLLVNCGKHEEFDRSAYEKAMKAALARLDSARLDSALCALTALEPNGMDSYQCVRHTLLLAAQSAYRYTQTKKPATEAPAPLATLDCWIEDASQTELAERGVAHGLAIAAGVALARDLGNLPGNICTPSYLADQAVAVGEQSDKLKVEVLDEDAMAEIGMGALLSVSHGSRQPAKLIVMHYRGGSDEDKPIVLVGKGLTFDAGGISIKPSEAMDEMKYDMCGGASVIGTLRALCALDLPINVIGVVPASENLPDGAANKPGDIVTSLSGQTIEILNTDAEGRLILCDALTYVERFEPALVVDMATLTGACIVGLGRHPSGLFSNDDGLADALTQAGEASADRVWRMPLWDDYQQQLDSNFADMANIGGRDGGAITAACFLSRYTKAYTWAHLDIAGTAWLTGKEKGATGRPVPLLSQFLLDRADRGT